MVPAKSNPKKKSNKELVIALLKKNTDGLTIIEIAQALKISRNTVPVILAKLEGAELIRIRPVGKAKLHYWEGKK
jgi:Mn-dependent DtxR family transcriptional regulator